MKHISPTLRIEPDAGGMITIGEASKLLRIRSQGLRQLVHDEYVPAPVKGKISLVAVVHGFVKARKDEATKADQELRWQRNQISDMKWKMWREGIR